MRLATFNRFQAFELTEDENRQARIVNPFTLALLQNKIARYAEEIINRSVLDDMEGSNAERKALIEIERLRAQVIVLEELFHELSVPEAEEDDPRDDTNHLIPPQPEGLSF